MKLFQHILKVPHFSIFLLLLFSTAAFCYDMEALKLQKVFIDYDKYFNYSTHPLVTYPGRDTRYLEHGLDLGVNFDIYKYIEFNNKVVSLTDSRQFRMVGWHADLGTRITRHLFLRYRHVSEHTLDDVWIQGFPVRDSIGVTFCIYGCEEKGNEILK